MSHHTPTTAIARIALLAGILLAILLLPTRSYQPAHAQEGSSLTETIKYAENRTDEVISYSAVDPDMGDTVTWTKSEAGGGDHDVDNNANDDFNISQSGELTFKSQPDYETPKGGSNNNANDYSVTLRASDGTLNVTWTLTVQVTNVEEAGKVMLSTLTPQEKVDLTATLTDPDKITGDNATSVKWQWARSTSRTGPWTDIKSTAPSATTTETYKPTKDDLRHYLRATATYMDGAPGGRKTAHAVSSKLVQKNLVNDAPVFHHAKGNVYANTSGDKRPTPDTFMVGQPLPSGNNLRLLREVAENSSAGTAVGARVELYDDDGDVLTYTLTGDNAGLFTIDRQTGQISVKAGTTLNYEVDSDNGPYQVTVTATDPNSATGDIRVVITVTNVDEAPKIASGGESVTYAEIGNDNNPNTATVFTYSATDDEDDNDNNDNTVVTWSLSGADSDKFTIGNTSEDRGQLKFKASPDYEDLSSSQKSNGLKLIVTAKDSDKMTASRNVTVNVTNVNEAGTLMLKGLQPQADTSIGTTLTDPDGIRSSPSVKWKWATSTDNGLQQTFSYIQGKTSSSYTPKSWDVGAYLFAFATYRDNEDPNIDRNLTVVSANTVQKKHKTNKPPVFSSSTYSDEEPGKSGIQISRTITENSSESVNGIGAAITATDDQNIDQNDDNSTTTAMDVLIYSLEGNDKSKFNINRVSGLLKANATLDFENPTDSNKDNKYEVTVKATDPKGSSGRIYVTINVTNVNEDPKITGGLTAISTPENTATTTVLSTYPATDDEDDKAKKALAWSVGDAAANFSIEGGSLRFKAAQNFEALDNATYSVTITVTDSDSQTATQSVTVTVTNVDEAETVTLSANRPKEGVALTATLTNDPDNVTESSVAWQWATSTSRSGPWTDIDNDNATRNQDARTSTYTPRKADVGSYLRATASYTDAQDPDKTKTSSASSAETVESKDYNNTAPVFRDDAGATTTTAKRSVAENSPTGTTVGKPVAATDIGRDGRQETLTYTLTGDDASSFTIDRQTGQIRVASGATLNYDGSDSPKRSYTVNVTAKDPSDTTENPSRATIEVTISVTDVLEAPKIASGGESVTYAEIGNDNNPNTATVFTYSATDDEDNYDNNDNTVVTWSLSGDDSDKFTIGNTGEDRGQLKFKTSPDYEDLSSSQKSNGLKLTVTATDSDQITASRNVTVNVTNVNEAGTLMLKGLQPQADTSIGTTLTDPDGIRSSPSVKWKWATSTDNGLQQTFSYIQGKTSSSYSPVAGDVNAYLFAFATYRDNQDSNTDRNLTVVSANTVQAKHKTNKSPVFSHNDEDPSKSGIQISRTIPENNSASVNDGIGDAITATDVQNINQDDSTATDVLIYSLEGNDKSKFNINRVSGLLKANATLDFENPTDSNKDNRYEVTVKATDPKGSSGRIYVTITVTNVNEAPTVVKKSLVITGPGTFDYPEDETNRQVATYRAVGPDGARRWSKSGDDAGDFQLSSAGALSFSSQPNFELPADADTDNVYEVTLQATVGDITDTYDVVVTVTNAEEAGTVTLSPTSRPRVGTAITAALTDPDNVTSANTTGSITTGVTWQWSKATATNSTWSNISGATTASYTPADDDADNFLRATASYADLEGSGKSAVATTTQTVLALTATPNDGTVSISPAQPVVGTAVTARLTDPDGSPTGLTWQWSWATTATAATSSWTNIPGATSASYTPVAADAGRYLRATASYSDAVDGAGQTAFGTSANAVTTVVAVDEYDRNADGRIDSTEVLEAVADYFAGTLSQARVLQVVALYFAGLPPTS